MPITMRQNLRVGGYILAQRLKRREKYPLVLQLEPLYQCNLACAGCGKIQHPNDILARRLSVQECIDAIEECGAPVVSVAGGEPLIHKEIGQIVAALVERKKFVYLCTNAILMGKKLDLFKPSPYFSWSVHIDGLKERHDESVCRDGVFDKAIAAIREAKNAVSASRPTPPSSPRTRPDRSAMCSTISMTTSRLTPCKFRRDSPTRERLTKSISWACKPRDKSSVRPLKAANARNGG